MRDSNMRSHSKAKPPRVLTRRRAMEVLGIGAAGLMLGACGGTGAEHPTGVGQAGGDAPLDFAARFAVYEPADEPNGDPTKVDWPDFVTRADPEIQRLYEFQIINGDLMRYMPCFCGCHLEDGHRSNRDCYVEAVNPDGSVVLDAMAPT